MGNEARWSTAVQRVFVQEKKKALNHENTAAMEPRGQKEREAANPAGEQSETITLAETERCASEIQQPKQNASLLPLLKKRGAWVAQQVKQLTPDSGSGHDLMILRPSPALGSALSMEPAWDSLSLSAPPLLCSLKLNKEKLKKEKKERWSCCRA